MCRSSKGLIKNILLDRDGTLIEDVGYLSNPEGIRFIEGSIEALRRIADKKINLFIVTNQSGIGRGYFSIEDYKKVKEKIHKTLNKNGIFIKEELFCPHKPDDKCTCRKPNIGMWKMLSQKYGLKPEESVIIGDKLSDMEFGIRAGLKFKILVLTGYGKKELERIKALKNMAQPDLVVGNLSSAIYFLEGFIMP